MSRGAAQARRNLPQGWESLWKHIENRALSSALTHYAEKHSEMFAFVRAVMEFSFSAEFRDNPELVARVIEDAHATRAAESKYEVENFWQYFLPETGGREEFIAVWLNMRFRPGVDPIEQAVADAREKPLHPLNASGELYPAVLGVAGHLQRRMIDRDIALPQEKIAKALSASQRAVSSCIQLAERRGYIQRVRNHNHAAGMAALFRFDLTRWNWKSGGEIQF